MISTLWNAQGIASRSSRATARIRQESCCLAKMMIQNLPLFTPNLPLQMLCRSYFGVFERWEPMLAWVRVAAIEHPVRAGQPWETPNKALDQELIGKTCGKSDEIYRICCKTYVCVCVWNDDVWSTAGWAAPMSCYAWQAPSKLVAIGWGRRSKTLGHTRTI